MNQVMGLLVEVLKRNGVGRVQVAGAHLLLGGRAR